ncbi:MAG TPA: HDIG domain-containing protein [Bacilli bacterium]|nr:HDIG domain-containing protein [Bacilli bacterium]
MKLSSSKALELLDNAKGKLDDDGWVFHQICVGDAAGVIAKALNLNEDYAKALGYIHDIGKIYDLPDDGALTHGINGYEYIKSLGYDEDYASICIIHSYLNNDIDCLAGESNEQGIKYNFQKEYVEKHKYTIYDKIINLCDLMCYEKVMTMEKRLIDLMIRHGVFATTQYHIKEALKLKKYFDDKLGFNLYDLFPEIKDNL